MDGIIRELSVNGKTEKNRQEEKERQEQDRKQRIKQNEEN